MNDIIRYLLESTVLLTILAGGYKLFLSRSRRFALNRAFLLSALVLSFIIPLLSVSADFGFDFSGRNAISSASEKISQRITVTKASEPTKFSVPAAAKLPTDIHISNEGKSEKSSSYSILSILPFAFYGGFTLALLIYYISGVYKILRTKRNAEEIVKIDGIDVAVTKSAQDDAYSFFRTIYVNRGVYDSEDFRLIFEHESNHVRSGHSFDICLVNLLKIFFWFNPGIYAFERFLKENHEYSTDVKIIKKGYNSNKYIQLLLGFTCPDFFAPPVNSFATSIIKKRLIMLKQNINSRKNLFRYILTFAAAGIFCFAFVCCNGGNDDGFAPNISKDQKAIVEKLLKYKAKSAYVVFCDKTGKIVHSDSVNYYLENGLQTVQNTFTDEAKLADVTAAYVVVRTVVGPDGRFLYAKALNGKIHDRRMKPDEYGLMTRAEQIILNTQLKELAGKWTESKSTLSRCYESRDIWIYFGHYTFYTDRQQGFSLYSSNPEKTEKIRNSLTDSLLYQIQGKVFMSKRLNSVVTGLPRGNKKPLHIFTKVTFSVNPELDIFDMKVESKINPEFDAALLEALQNEVVDSHIWVKNHKPSGKKYDTTECIKVTWNEDWRIGPSKN